MKQLSYLALLILCLSLQSGCTGKKSPKKAEKGSGKEEIFSENSPLQKKIYLESPYLHNENGFPHFQKAVKALYYPNQKSREIQNILNGRSWDGALVREVLKKNKKALQHLEDGLLCNRCELPPMGLNEWPRGYLYTWTKVGRIAVLEAILAFKTKKALQGFRSVFKALRLGYLLEKSAGDWSEFIMGHRVQKSALSVLPFLSGKASSGALRAMIKGVEKYQGAILPALKAVFRREIEMNKRRLQGLARGEKVFISNGFGGRLNLFQILKIDQKKLREKIKQKNFLNIKQTITLFERDNKALLESLSMSYEKGKKHLYPYRLAKTKILSEISSFSKGNPPKNALGKLVYFYSAQSLMGLLIAQLQLEVTFSLARVFIALKLYKQQKGSLPASLRELVPEFLKKIPRDPFDGKEVKYSAEKKEVYSMGKVNLSLGH